MSVKLKYTDTDAAEQKVLPAPTGSDVGTSSYWDELFYLDSGGTAIAAGDWVVVDITSSEVDVGRAIKQSTTTADEPAVGVALEAIAAGTWGTIRRRGLISDEADREGVTVKLTGVADGNAIATNTTLGQGTVAANTDINIVGVVLDAASPLVVDVRC
ncbi:MAG: hypothetical protein JSV86_05230 [Gemmatimonadota bacterium]|jgi:DUF1009 family protein|nr:MAG: hypothetical protein JSV86_05230 [Gemmatimonadota bacterium]